MKTISRAVMRGKPLDKDCKRAYISKHEYGPNDNRCFCNGLYAEWSDCEIITIDEAISHALEVAERYDRVEDSHADDGLKQECIQCAADHRRLAEWLMEYKDLKAEQNDQYVFIHELMSELKEAKQLLKSVIDEWHIVCEWGNCGEYCGWYKNGKCTQEWSGKSKALKLIGETNVDQ